MSDSVDDLLDDVQAAFCYRNDMTYQERAHEYIERMGVARETGDTAMQACVGDMVARALRLGAGGACIPGAADLASVGAASELVKSALGMLSSARRLLEE